MSYPGSSVKLRTTVQETPPRRVVGAPTENVCERKRKRSHLRREQRRAETSGSLMMIVNALLPVFMTFLISYLAAWRHDADGKAATTLNNIVMPFTLPLSLFAGMGTISRGQLGQNLPMMAALFVGLIVPFGVVLGIARYAFGREYVLCLGAGRWRGYCRYLLYELLLRGSTRFDRRRSVPCRMPCCSRRAVGFLCIGCIAAKSC